MKNWITKIFSRNNQNTVLNFVPMKHEFYPYGLRKTDWINSLP